MNRQSVLALLRQAFPAQEWRLHQGGFWSRFLGEDWAEHYRSVVVAEKRARLALWIAAGKGGTR